MFSERLQLVIERLDWNQSKLAREIGSSSVQITRWLHNKVNPTASSVRRIVAATGCNPDWLMNGEGPMFQESSPHYMTKEEWAVHQREVDEYLTDEEIAAHEDEQMEMDEWLEEEERKKARQQAVSKLLAKTAVVLESDTMHHIALAGVINALYRAVRLEEKIPKPPPTGLKALLKTSERS